MVTCKVKWFNDAKGYGFIEKNCYFKQIGKLFMMLFFSKESDLQFRIGLHFKPKLAFNMDLDLIWIHVRVAVL